MIYRKARYEEIPLLLELRKKQLVDEGIAASINIDNSLKNLNGSIQYAI